MFQYISDIHIEKSPFKFPKAGAPILFVAGDLGWPRRAHFRHAFSEMSHNWREVFYVPGNHEYDAATCAKSMAAIDEEIDGIAADYKNLHVLRAGRRFTTPKFDVVGCTLWSFTQGRSWRQQERNSRFLNEVQFLNETIQNSSKPLVVMTHYLPSYRLSPYDGWASNSEFLLRKPVSVWICGHSHIRRRTSIYGIPILINAGKQRKLEMIY